MGKALSIGVTTYNEEQTISKVLEILLKESPRSSEIIVIAGGEDQTVGIVKSYAKKDHRIKLLKEETRRGKPAALNQILKHASGKIIVLTDGDVFPERDALSRLVGVRALPSAAKRKRPTKAVFQAGQNRPPAE